MRTRPIHAGAALDVMMTAFLLGFVILNFGMGFSHGQ